MRGLQDRLGGRVSEEHLHLSLSSMKNQVKRNVGCFGPSIVRTPSNPGTTFEPT